MTSMLIAKYSFSNIMEEQEALYAGEADFWVQSSEGFFPETEIAWLEQQEEVNTGITSLLKQGFVDMKADSQVQRTVRFTGISDFQTDILKLPLKEGDITREGLIISENAANLWNKEVGDTVSFEGLGTLEITAIVYEGPMLNSPRTLAEANQQNFRVIVPLEQLQSASGLEHQISNYRFQVKEGVNHEGLLTSYQTHFQGSPLFIQPVVVDNQQYNDVDSIYYVFDFIAILAVFISAFIAYNAIHTSIAERKKEFGIMKSLGFTKGNIVRLIVQEISIYAVLGVVVGIGLGVLLGNVILDILITAVATQDISYDTVIIQPVIVSTIVGLLFPFAASVLPLYKAGKTPILEAMFEKEPRTTRTKWSIFRIIAGFIFTGVGFIDNMWAFLFLFIGLVLLFPIWMRVMQVLLPPLLSLLFGFSGKQAIHSIKQFEKRNANTAAMLAIGVSLALFMSAALQALPKGIEDDIRLTFGGDIHLTKETPWMEEDVEKLYNMPQVVDVYPLLEVPNVTWYTEDRDLREFSVMSYSENSPQIFTIEEETTEKSAFPEIYVGDRALRESGNKVGDIWTLHTPAGEQPFFIKGSVLTSHYSNYVAFTEENVIKEVMDWPWSYQMLVDLEVDENGPYMLAQAIEQFGAPISGGHTLTETIEKTTSGLTGIDDLFQVLLLLIIGISAIGISNTLFMNTIERVREIGTMRAIGFTKSQVRIMIIVEGLFIGMTGVIVGTVYGILVIYLNSVSASAQGLLQFTIPWGSLILAIAGGILFALLASWLPSHTASRISVKEAIQYE